MISFKIAGANPSLPPTLVVSDHKHTWGYFLTENAKIVRVALMSEGTIISAPIVDQVWNLKHNATSLAILVNSTFTDTFVYFGNVNGQVYKARLGAQGNI